MKKIIISGPQCSGKTTLINELSKEFFIVKESAASIIFEERVLPSQENFLDFQEKVFETQKKNEAQIPKNNRVVFLDRSHVDQIIYYKEKNITPPKKLAREIKKSNYSAVIFLEIMPKEYWTKTINGKPKFCSYEMGAERGKRLLAEYKAQKIPLFILPVMSVQERAKKVKEILAQLEKGYF